MDYGNTELEEMKTMSNNFAVEEEVKLPSYYNYEETKNGIYDST